MTKVEGEECSFSEVVKPKSIRLKPRSKLGRVVKKKLVSKKKGLIKKKPLEIPALGPVEPNFSATEVFKFLQLISLISHGSK